MHLMLQHTEPDDFVIATGATHTVRDLCELAFSEVGLDYQDYIQIDKKHYRPAEVDQLIGDASKARKVLDWKPTYTFEQLIQEMVHEDLKSLTQQALPEQRGLMI
jgi:GDPmannose 4,6-dehydratase